MRRIAGALLLLAGCGETPPPATSEPSVLVSVVAPVRGTLLDTITAYGSATPAANGVDTLSSAQPGQVTRLAVTAGATVRAGQPLLVFTAAPSAASGFEQATSALDAARRARATTAQLLTQQLATRDQLVQADKVLADAISAREALRRDGAGEAVRTFTAPFAGTVTAIAVAPGDRTAAGAALITVARTGGVVVTAGVDPAERSRLRAGQGATLDRLTRGSPVAGRVVRVDGVLNPKTRQVDVDIGFPTGAILPGEALKVAIRVGDLAGWLVPHGAVVITDAGARVYQVAGGKARAVAVRIIGESPETDVVDGALYPARAVIVDGAYQVEDGGAVRVPPRR